MKWSLRGRLKLPHYVMTTTLRDRKQSYLLTLQQRMKTLWGVWDSHASTKALKDWQSFQYTGKQSSRGEPTSLFPQAYALCYLICMPTQRATKLGRFPTPVDACTMQSLCLGPEVTIEKGTAIL